MPRKPRQCPSRQKRGKDIGLRALAGPPLAPRSPIAAERERRGRRSIGGSKLRSNVVFDERENPQRGNMKSDARKHPDLTLLRLRRLLVKVG